MIQALLRILAPEDCIECGAEGSGWCEWCRLGHEPLPSRCYRCHAMTSDYRTCNTCKRQTTIKRLYVCAEYDGLPKAVIKNLKFHSKRHFAQPIARQIADTLPLLSPEAIITSVPTAPQRVRQRGFDHTLLIAKEVAGMKGVTYQSLLAKTDNSRQVGSHRDVRKQQVIGSFRIKYGRSLDKPILLIDDVVTTGATLSECIKVLRNNGAKNVDCAVFAYSK